MGEHGIACNDLDHALVEQIDIASKSFCAEMARNGWRSLENNRWSPSSTLIVPQLSGALAYS
jgi:hypothetical protein